MLGSIFKARIGYAIVLCAVAGMAVMPGPSLPALPTATLALVVFLSSCAAGAFNHYAERDLDAMMPRTRNRPFVTGELQANKAWLASICMILAIAVWIASRVLNLHVAIYIFLGAFVYGIVYTIWLKRHTAWNIVIGGLAGSFAVLAGAAAVDPDLSINAVILAVTLFLWTPPHFWSLATMMQTQYANAGVPMLPVVVGAPKAAKIILAHTMALVAASLLPGLYGMGPIYLAGASVGGAYFIWRSVKLVQTPGPKQARANFKASFVQLGLLLMAALVDGTMFH